MFLCFYVLVRVFLAIEIPDKIKKELVGIQRDLESRMPGVRWEKAEKFHITLVFLGKVEEKRVGELEKVVQKGVKGIKGIKVRLAGVGVFPKKRPRVVLVEVGEGREEIERLQKVLAEALAGAGFDFARLSKPHVTLGRFEKGIKGVKGIKGTKGIGGFRVREVVIVESRLHPTGAIHTPLKRIPLNK